MVFHFEKQMKKGGVFIETKRVVSPFAWLNHHEDGRRLRIDVELPEVDQNKVSLDMKKDSFCISAPGEDNIEYQGCFFLEHEVEPEKTESRYEDGLFRIFTPFKGWEPPKESRTTLYVNAPVVRG